MKYFVLIVLICANVPSVECKKITIKGAAWNSKLGAQVIGEEGVYVLDNHYAWDEKYLRKNVVVTGYLKVRTIKPTKKKLQRPFSHSPGLKELKIIKRATWSLDSLNTDSTYIKPFLS